MLERDVNLVCVAATVLWIGTFALIATGALVGMVASWHAANVLMCFGLALSAAAATVTIKAMLSQQNRLLRDAFDLGKDAGQAGLRQIR